MATKKEVKKAEVIRLMKSLVKDGSVELLSSVARGAYLDGVITLSEIETTIRAAKAQIAKRGRK